MQVPNYDSAFALECVRYAALRHRFKLHVTLDVALGDSREMNDRVLGFCHDAGLKDEL